jgi:hypothetical protein
MNGASMRAFLMVGLVLFLGALAHGCGRTSLDEGFGPAGATGGAPGTGGQAGAGIGGQAGRGIGGQAGRGIGGTTGGGQGGVGPGTMVGCGTSFCVAGKQACCNHLDTTGHTTQACIDVSDPGGCLDGVVLCSADILCPKLTPSCCIQALGVGYCQRAGLQCTPIRP